MSNQSTYYIEGVKVAMTRMGLTKTALGPVAGQALRGIARGAIGGGLTGGIGGAIAAPEGEGGRGFLRGMGTGALLGGAAGGLQRGLSAHRAINPKVPSTTADASQRLLPANAGPSQTRGLPPAATGAEAVPSTTPMPQRVVRLPGGGTAGAAAGGLGGLLAGVSTPKRGIIDRAREELGV